MRKKLLLSMAIFLAGGVCGVLLPIQNQTTPNLEVQANSDSPSMSAAFFDFWLEETLITAEVESSYDAETNSVHLGNDITVSFNLETDELEGIGMDCGPIDLMSLTSTQRERLNYYRDQLVLSEIEKLFGTDSVKFQNVATELENTQES